ncbi:MAG TPA: XdhC family protein [Baekduia sp.]|uniref:XdhC family protein n=1 Tax=Baekduia sp. TaxID=2600305 RepID=UPI002CB766DF|nr:XdhC family protein [Baekduia sp.]HMJ36201.1 XdhC family protein [Baekduia sp.]
MIATGLADRARRLQDERAAFVTATVVRAQRPTSAHPGDVALVLADGTVEGFVGGACAESSVRLHGLRAMETGEPLLLRLVPGSGEDEPVVDGAVTTHNPCLSGGTLEIFLDPCLPPPRVVVVGDAPVALALRALAPHVGLEAVRPAGDVVQLSGEDLALVVASHGRDEEPALAAALTEGVAYVALVASPRRGEAVRAALDCDDALRSRLRTPAGLDIGARTPPEIALAILAEIVQERRSGTPRGTPVPTVPLTVPAGPSSGGGGGACCHGHGEH